jgi:hypothetical protein
VLRAPRQHADLQVRVLWPSPIAEVDGVDHELCQGVSSQLTVESNVLHLGMGLRGLLDIAVPHFVDVGLLQVWKVRVGLSIWSAQQGIDTNSSAGIGVQRCQDMINTQITRDIGNARHTRLPVSAL